MNWKYSPAVPKEGVKVIGVSLIRYINAAWQFGDPRVLVYRDGHWCDWGFSSLSAPPFAWFEIDDLPVMPNTAARRRASAAGVKRKALQRERERIDAELAALWKRGRG